MANRSFNRMQAIDKEVKHIFGYFTIDDSSGNPVFDGATAADIANRQLSVGVKSIVRTAAGKYTITLGTFDGDTDKYNKLLMFSCILEDDTHHGANGGVGFQLDTDSSSSTVSSNHKIQDGLVHFMALQENGQSAEIKNGDAVRFHIVVKNSGQPGVGV